VKVRNFVSMALFVAVACTSGAPDKKISLTGSSTVAPLMAEIGKLYEKQNPGSRVDVQMGGSSRGAKDAAEGLVDVGMISRKVKPEEEAKIVPHLLAHDGIALIVNNKNPLKEITRDTVIQIFTGKVTNWSAVGGPDAPITVVNKAEGRSTLELFLEHFKLKAPDIKAGVIIGDNQQGIKSVSADPNAIGYVSIGSAAISAEAGDPIHMLMLDGVVASAETVKNGSYPLSRPLNLVTQKGKEIPAHVTKLFELIKTREAADVISAQGFVTVQ
jgi:phosphate transport system substrate-binding protein